MVKLSNFLLQVYISFLMTSFFLNKIKEEVFFRIFFHSLQSACHANPIKLSQRNSMQFFFSFWGKKRQWKSNFDVLKPKKGTNIYMWDKNGWFFFQRCDERKAKKRPMASPFACGSPLLCIHMWPLLFLTANGSQIGKTFSCLLFRLWSGKQANPKPTEIPTLPTSLMSI